MWHLPADPIIPQARQSMLLRIQMTPHLRQALRLHEPPCIHKGPPHPKHSTMMLEALMASPIFYPLNKALTSLATPHSTILRSGPGLGYLARDLRRYVA